MGRILAQTSMCVLSISPSNSVESTALGKDCSNADKLPLVFPPLLLLLLLLLFVGDAMERIEFRDGVACVFLVFSVVVRFILAYHPPNVSSK